MLKSEDLKISFVENFRTMVSPVTLIALALAIVISVVAGPFGTLEAMTLWVRIVYWTMVISVGVVTGYMVRAITTALVGYDRPVVFDVIAIGSMTVVFSPLLIMISLFIERMTGVSPPPMLSIALYVFSVSAAVFVLRRVLLRTEPRTYAFLEGTQVPRQALAQLSEPRLLRRLSPDVQGRVVRITARDHHVEIVTEAGSQMLRLRLADAILEMDTVEGYCTHRSHWVARWAFVRVERLENSKMCALLSNGDCIPISRKYKPDLEAAGLV